MANKILWDYTEDTNPARTDNVLLQASATDLYTRATIASILAQLVAGDIPDISTTYALVTQLTNYLDKATYDSDDDGVLDVSTIPDISATYATQTDIADLVPTINQSTIYYVGKHGNDAQNGLTIEQAFLTFSAAMSAASSGDAIVCFDDGEYAEGLTVKDNVNVYAPNATLTVTGSQLVMGTSTVTFDKVQRASGSNAMILFSGATGRQKLNVTVIEDNGDNIALRFTNASIPIIHFKELYVSGGGSGIADFTGSEHYHITGDDLYLNSNNAKGIVVNASAQDGIITIQHIVEIGTRTGTIGIDMQAGTANVIANEIRADTALTIADGATLNLVAPKVVGDINNDGSLKALVADNKPGSNIVLNPNGAIGQRFLNPDTANSVTDADYGLDRWRVLSELGAQVQRISGNTQRYAARIIQSNVTSQKTGAIQYIEGRDCKHLRGETVTLSGSLRCSTGVTVKAVVVQWNSTEDTITNDPIETWGATTTLVTNFTKAGGEKSITLAANTWKDFSHTVTLNSSFNNLCVLLYVTSDLTQNATLDYEAIQLARGIYAQPFNPRTYSDELAVCQRYYERLGGNASDLGIMSSMVRTSSIAYSLPVYIEKRTNPTFNTVGTFNFLHNSEVVACTYDSVIDTAGLNTAILRWDGSFTTGDSGILRCTTTGSYIEVDAEL